MNSARSEEVSERPWLVMGDFNEILYDWESQSRCWRDGRGMDSFRETLNACGLADVEASGRQFTFSNKRLFPKESKARLDRFLANQHWLESFPEAEALNGTAATSDHCPIILHLKKKAQVGVRKTFRFEVIWKRYSGFKEVVSQWWSEALGRYDPRSALRICGDRLSHWNTDVLGNVQREIKELKEALNNLSGIRRTVKVANKENEMRRELEEWLEREEALWLQRSRVDWLRSGDRNTPFLPRESIAAEKEKFH